MQQMHVWQVREIGQNDIFPFLGNEFYDNGARYAVINDGRDWRATGAAGCPVTPVGIYGFGKPYIVYAGENGKLYAFRGFNDEVRAYESLEDLLEEALEGHMPIGLDD